MIVNAERFNEVLLKKLEEAPWRPGKWMMISWMKDYANSEKSKGFYKDGVYVVKGEGDSVDLQGTVIQWVAGFKQDAPLWSAINPFWKNLLQGFIDFFLQNLPAILAALLGMLAINPNTKVVGVYKD